MRAILSMLAAGAAVVLLAACGSGGEGPVAPRASARTPQPDRYRPISAEQYPNGKRLAANVAQRALTYEPGASPRSVARSLGASALGLPRLAKVLGSVVDPDARSSAEVIYPQLSGVTASSLGVMVVLRQSATNSRGETSSLTRVVDVRLRRSGAGWALDSIGSFGGPARSQPATLTGAAKRVLENPRIELPNSGRWDIYSGEVAPELLDALSRAAHRSRLSVSVIDSGHPGKVWQTSRPSAHASGLAVDIWAVDGVPVIEQRGEGSPAYRLAASFAAGGAEQLGSPWVFAGGGSNSFSDEVHQDHIHLQQSAGS